jgi:hypothetical protein
MSEIVAKRPVGRPKGSTMNIMERIKRYQLAEKCAALTPEIIDFWTSVVRTKHVPLTLRLQAADRLMDRAYGRPAQAVMVDQTSREMSVQRIQVRWLAPDPNDTSKYIPPEPD